MEAASLALAESRQEAAADRLLRSVADQMAAEVAQQVHDEHAGAEQSRLAQVHTKPQSRPIPPFQPS